MITERNASLANTANWIIVFVFLLATLIYFDTFLKGFAIAILIWYLIKKLRDTIAKIKIGKIKLPKWLITATSTITVFLILYLIIQIIASNLQKLIVDIHLYRDHIKDALVALEGLIGTKEDISTSFVHLFDQYKNEIIGYAGSFAGAIGKSLMIVIYVIFLLLEESLFNLKIKKTLNMTSRGATIHKIGTAITLLFDRYLSVKTFTSFLTGILSYFILLILGVELAALWAFLIFLFNFIPTIGSIVATAFPGLFALVQFGTLNMFFTVLACVGIVQLLVGNLVEPRIMGERLNISPMVVLLGLTLWGFIWGVTGMLLSIPITSTLIIVFSQFEDTRAIAIMLSKNGEIGIIDQPEDSIDPEGTTSKDS
ncbi:hypothetical protein BFP72_02405 [Reichenbachiella sp. 5M10]|uniref:AI-2E family transporter n=1 Tax=Reichenbachiella sp. 5M10 TaxID=1889772 RepID=UPI000C152E20|nr:AI-2E family transporter [Reichenbachiella sp. 5M10]PIB34353.1 hypothetical protein BFP72_02405 [Reichenbachiella sp. 5M10]